MINSNKLVLLTKDCVHLTTWPIYGNKYWKTPNIDALAEKGTVFRHHYTCAPSTAMAMSGMLTGHWPYEFERKEYIDAVPNEFPSIFDVFQQQGYETHLIWDKTWMYMAWCFVREFGDDKKTIIHNLDIAQPTGSDKSSRIIRDDKLLTKTTEQIYQVLTSIDFSQKQFVWIHLPHILKGRQSYMDDVDVFDEIVGFVRDLVGDDNIVLSTDHGHMNMQCHKVGYGFDVYESALRIPLITPRIDGLKEVFHITSNVDLPTILLEKKIPKRDFVIADTQYYGQNNRKTAIIDDRFKYIFNKKTKSEELYDLTWDEGEKYNILKEFIFDKDRCKYVKLSELYFYPYKEEALKELIKLRAIKDCFWREPSTFFSLKYNTKYYIKKIKKTIINIIKDKI